MKRSIRNLVKIAAIATTLTAAPSFAFNGQVSSEAYGGVDSSTMSTELRTTTPLTGGDRSEFRGQVASEAYGGADQWTAERAASIVPSVTLKSTDGASFAGQVSSEAYGGVEYAAIAEDTPKIGLSAARAASKPHGG